MIGLLVMQCADVASCAWLQMFEMEEVTQTFTSLVSAPPEQLQPLQKAAHSALGTAVTLLLTGGVTYFSRAQADGALTRVIALAQVLQSPPAAAQLPVLPAKAMLDQLAAHQGSQLQPPAADGEDETWPAGNGLGTATADFRKVPVLPMGGDLLTAQQHYKYPADSADGYLCWQV